MRSKKSPFILLFFIALLAAFFYTALKSPKSQYQVGFLVGQQLPEFSVKLLNGKEKLTAETILADSSEYKLLNFFASWCTTCHIEHPDLLELSTKQNIKVYGIVWRDSKNRALKWLRDHGNPYDVLALDNLGSTKFEFGLIGVPESFLIDADNQIIGHFRGPVDLEQIYDIIKY